MPCFIGDKVAREHNQTAFQELYEFKVMPPNEGGYDPLAILPAWVTTEVAASHMAEELARHFGEQHEGDVIEIVLEEPLFDGSTHKFRLPVRAHFASQDRGPEYIQIGLDDLQAYFDLACFASSLNDAFMEITLQDDSDRECEEEPGEDLAAVG